MKKDRFQRLLVEQLAILKNLTASKGVEYSRSDDDQLANFRRQATELGVGPEKILAVYLNKHLDAIKSFLKTGEVLSEPIYGRIDDAILYLMLLKAMVIDKTAPKSLEDAFDSPRGVPTFEDLVREYGVGKQTPPLASPGVQWPPVGPYYTLTTAADSGTAPAPVGVCAATGAHTMRAIHKP